MNKEHPRLTAQAYLKPPFPPARSAGAETAKKVWWRAPRTTTQAE
jgi:hypothetical protein